MVDTNKKIENSLKKLENIDNKESKEYAQELENLGLYYYENDDIEKTIETLEESLDTHATINEGYKTLMGIYNAKRSEAAKDGNMNEINMWIDKMDKMRDIAKKGTILR